MAYCLPPGVSSSKDMARLPLYLARRIGAVIRTRSRARPCRGPRFAFGPVTPQLIGGAFTEPPDVELDLPVNDRQGLLQVGDLLLIFASCWRRMSNRSDSLPGPAITIWAYRRISGSGIPEERNFMQTLSLLAPRRSYAHSAQPSVDSSAWPWPEPGQGSSGGGHHCRAIRPGAVRTGDCIARYS